MHIYYFFFLLTVERFPFKILISFRFLQVLVEIPYIFAQSAVYSVIVYAMIGFEWTAAKFFWFLFFEFCSLLYMTYYGMMTVAITPNAMVGAIVAASFYGIFNLFSGFIIPRPVSSFITHYSLRSFRLTHFCKNKFFF